MYATRAVVEFVLGHPDADALIRDRRPALVDCLEHALGKATARGCAQRIAGGDTSSAYVRRSLLRFCREPEAAARRLVELFRLVPDGGVDEVDAVDEAAIESPVPRSLLRFFRRARAKGADAVRGDGDG